MHAQLVQIGTPAPPPADDVLPLASAKSHLRVDHDDEDELIRGYVAAAVSAVESFTRRRLLAQSWEYRLPSFPCRIVLPLGPVQSVTQVQYVDDAGALQAVAPAQYHVSLGDEMAYLSPAYGMSWPVPRAELDAVRVRFVVGWPSAAEIPPAIMAAIQLLVGSWYQNREAVITGTIVTELALGVKNLLLPWARFD